MKPYHVVITTIGDGAIIKALSDNLERHGHLDDTTLWVITDHKTPVECYTACLNTRADVQAITPQYQEDWGRRFPLFYNRIPWNSDSRRNIGYLMALEAGCEWLILLDDDNYPEDDDLIGMHTEDTAPLIDTRDDWYNYFINLECCDIFPRGYPYTGRVNTDVQRLNNHFARVSTWPWR